MASLGNYTIPKPLKDEDKWFRFFTKTQLLYVGVAAFIDMGIIAFFRAVHIPYVSIVLSEAVMIAALILAFVSVPTDRFMIGGGYSLRAIAVRLVRKRFRRNKVLYVKGYDENQYGGG